MYTNNKDITHCNSPLLIVWGTGEAHPHVLSGVGERHPSGIYHAIDSYKEQRYSVWLVSECFVSIKQADIRYYSHNTLLTPVCVCVCV